MHDQRWTFNECVISNYPLRHPNDWIQYIFVDCIVKFSKEE